MSELIPWPDSSEYQTAHKSLEGRTVFHTSNSSQLEHYERARAEAALARLRVAVEALKLIGAGRGGICDETLSAIGEIPLTSADARRG